MTDMLTFYAGALAELLLSLAVALLILGARHVLADRAWRLAAERFLDVSRYVTRPLPVVRPPTDAHTDSPESSPNAL